MNTFGFSSLWATWLVPSALIAFYILPCYLETTKVLANPFVSRVTTYHDPYWNIRTPRSPRPSQLNFDQTKITTPMVLTLQTEPPPPTVPLQLQNSDLNNNYNIHSQDHLQRLPNYYSHPIAPFPTQHIIHPTKNITSKRRRRVKKINHDQVVPVTTSSPSVNPSWTVGSPVFEDSTDSNPSRKTRRRRLIRLRRKKPKDQYFRPTYTFKRESDPVIRESSIEPIDHAPEFGFESFESKKFWPSPSPIADYVGIAEDLDWSALGRPYTTVSSATKIPKFPTTIESTTPNGNIVIYQRGAATNVQTPKINNSKESKTNHVRRKKPDAVTQDEPDLHLSESYNPYLNASVPISNDLRNSLHFNLDLLHPLFNSDTSLRDISKIPENKTIGIKHKLNDSPVSVKVAPDLHHEFDKNPFLNHDAIISSDYERQLFKSRPRIEVKHSVSMSTSTTMSTFSSLSQQKRPVGNHQHISTTSKPLRTSPMPSSSFITEKSDVPKLTSLSSFPSTTTQPSPLIITSTLKPTTRYSPPSVPTTTPNIFEILGLAFTTLTTPQPFTTTKLRTTTTEIPITTTTKHTVPTTAHTTRPPTVTTDARTSTSTATTHKPSLSTTTFKAGSTIFHETLPITETTSIVEPQTRGKTSVPITATSSEILTATTPSTTTTQNPKTPFTLRPKPPTIVTVTAKPRTTRAPIFILPETTPKPIIIMARATNVPTTTSTLTTATKSINNPINTFLDSIDESGKNNWKPKESQESAKAAIIETTTTRKPTTRKPTTKIQISKDPPLILMPPFTGEKDEPPITLTTPNPLNHVTQPIVNDTVLLQQLLGILNEDLGISTVTTSTSTTTPRPSTTTRTTTTTTTTRKPTTTKPKPTVRLTTRAPATTQSFNLFNLFAPQTNPPLIHRPAQTTSPNDFFGLLNLFQPTTPAPRPATPAPANNDIFNLFNLFQQPSTTTPAPAGNDLFNIFNLFTQPTRPPPTTTRRPTPPPTTPAPAANDLFGLLNLFQPSNPGQPTNRPNNNPTTPESELDALVQQALLESLGLKPNNNLFSQQASNVNQKLASPESGLSDADLKSIYALIDQQQAGSSTTEITANGTSNAIKKDPMKEVLTHLTLGKAQSVTNSAVVAVTTPAPITSPESTTTLMPIFRNMLKLFGLADPTKPTEPPGILQGNPGGPVYNPLSTSAASQNISNENLMLQILAAAANKSSGKTMVNLPVSSTPTTAATTPTPPTTAAQIDFLSQLLNLGQTVQDSSKQTNPATVNKEFPQTQHVQSLQQLFQAPQKQPDLQPQQTQQQPALDIQSILNQLNTATSPKPEVAPSESNIFHILANQFTPKPQKPNGLYYWVDLNAFMGDNPSNPQGGLRPKLGSKDYFIKVKREASRAGTIPLLNT